MKPDLSMKKIIHDPCGNMRIIGFTSRCGRHTWEVFLGCPRSVEVSGFLAQMRTFLWCFPGLTARRMWNPTKTSETKRWCTVKFERLVAGRASARNKWSIIGSKEAAWRQMKLVTELHRFLVIDAALCCTVSITELSFKLSLCNEWQDFFFVQTCGVFFNLSVIKDFSVLNSRG